MLAALLTIWSNATQLKLNVMYSTIGRRPTIAAPMPMPVKPSSEIGVSITRRGPNWSSMPWLTLYAPLYSATSSPIRKTRSSRSISSVIACRRASRYCKTAMRRSLLRDVRGHRDVVVEGVGVGLGGLLGELDRLVNLGLDLL